MSGRIRSIKPEWLEDERLALTSPEARVLSVALLLLADDHGNGRMVPQIEASRIFPASPGIFAKALDDLRSTLFVDLYRLNGQTYFTIRNWTKHQRVDKPGKPRVPGPLTEGVEKIPGSLAKVPGTLATDPDLDPDPDHEHRTTSTTPLASTKKQKRLPAAKPAGGRSVAFRLAWFEHYRKKLGTDPAWGKRENGQVTQLLGSTTEDELIGLVPYFFAWQRPEVIRAGYSFGKGAHCFVLKVDELRADIADQGRRQTAAQIAERERLRDDIAVNDDGLTRLEFIEANVRNPFDERSWNRVEQPGPSDPRQIAASSDQPVRELHHGEVSPERSPRVDVVSSVSEIREGATALDGDGIRVPRGADAGNQRHREAPRGAPGTGVVQANPRSDERGT